HGSLSIRMRIFLFDSRYTKQPLCVTGCLGGKLLDRHAAYFGQTGGRIYDASRLIRLLAPKWMRRKVRTIGFDQNAIIRDRRRNLSEVLGFLESHHPSETDIQSQIQTFAR